MTIENSIAGEPERSCACPICASDCQPLDKIDFNKSCEEHKGLRLPLAGVQVEYLLCRNCGFCFAPTLCRWTLDQFSTHIYNDEYVFVDPEFSTSRPIGNAEQMIRWFGAQGQTRTHLDYGGGHGLLSDVLRDSGWNTKSYDPFFDRDTPIADLGTFDLITAFEVFEHVPDVNVLASNLRALLNDSGSVIFSTVLSDGCVQLGTPLRWWYAAPRNGHISLHSSKSLGLLARKFGFNFDTCAPGLHALWRTRPPWTGSSMEPPRDMAGRTAN